MYTLEQVKKLIRVSSDEYDELLTLRLASATTECARYLNEAICPDVPEVNSAIVLLVQADYEGDPLKRSEYRSCAEQLMAPYRKTIGV